MPQNPKSSLSNKSRPCRRSSEPTGELRETTPVRRNGGGGFNWSVCSFASGAVMSEGRAALESSGP